MSALIKDESNNWRRMGVPFTRVGGSWKPAKQMWTKIDGEWKKIFDLELNENFDGSGDLDNQLTPGNSVWKTYRGSWSKSGGVVTAGELNSVAGIETGVSEDIVLEIDSSDTSQAGHGVAFWIQDQSNWWGAQTFYENFSFTNAPIPPSSITYNHTCSNFSFIVTSVTNFGGWQVFSSSGSTITPTGQNSTIGTRNCRPNGTLSAYSAVQGLGCVDGCTGANAPAAGSPCNAPVFVVNCGSTCTNCSAFLPTPSTGFISPTCPSPTSGTFTQPTCSVFGFTNYFCTAIPGFSTCSHSFQNVPSPGFASFSDTSFSNLPNSPASPPCSPAFGRFCNPDPVTVVVPGSPGTTVNATRRQTRLIRSQSGSVSTVSSTTSPDYGGEIGSLEVTLEPNAVKTRAYAGFNKGGTAYPTQTYSIPSGTTKSTKHGIVVSGTPSNQGYSISRFKATLV